MSRASISLLSRFARRRSSLTLLHTNHISRSSPSPSQSPFPLFTRSNGSFLESNPFRAYPSRKIGTLVDESISAEEKSRLEEDFMSAETSEEKIIALGKMEPWIEPRRLGMASIQIGLKLEEEGGDPEKVLGFANRALKLLASDGDESSLLVAITLKLMGSANFRMRRFSDSLESLNKANRVLGRLEEDDSDFANVLPVSLTVERLLVDVKIEMGKWEEMIVNQTRCLEIKGRISGYDSVEFGDSCRELAEAYASVKKFKEALLFCLKSLEIKRDRFGDVSVEVGNDRRFLWMIYNELEEHQKALEQIGLYQDILRKHGRGSELPRTEVEAANVRIAGGRYEEAVKTLRALLQQTETIESETRVLALTSMAKALCFQDKFSESKTVLEAASEILDKEDSVAVSPSKIIEAYMEMAMQYESVNEVETAISLLKKALTLLERVPGVEILKVSVLVRLGSLLGSTGKGSLAVPYLESAAKALTERFGADYFGLGYVYSNMGTMYSRLGKHQLAAERFAAAKEIMDASRGPDHEDSIRMCQYLAIAYEDMGSYARAIEFQQKVVEAREKHGHNEEDELREAHRLLERLKKKASHTG